MNQLKTGVIVKNKAGREKDRLYLVIEIDDNYVYVVDGETRQLENPKKKNKKHLTTTGQQLQITINTQSNDIPNENAKIRKELRRIGKTEGIYV